MLLLLMTVNFPILGFFLLHVASVKSDIKRKPQVGVNLLVAKVRNRATCSRMLMANVLMTPHHYNQLGVMCTIW